MKVRTPTAGMAACTTWSPGDRVRLIKPLPLRCAPATLNVGILGTIAPIKSALLDDDTDLIAISFDWPFGHRLDVWVPFGSLEKVES